ncbi:hypothetical protein AVEN_179093-1 [Araneus ventricosus]|uniref:Uncharacterized protein n=1 Tax=Araneus ventricosus TaxID=182803 RepID=A0A4Y2F8Z9_ARAVE|nr:hypothetical protein AVEN_179093-1 [Araneus ventricosus]
MLIKTFSDENITVEQVVEDAEATIASKTVEGARQSDCAIIVGEDIDLTVILTALASDNNLLFLMRPEKKQSASCTNVPEDIKNRPKLYDDVITFGDETVEELLDEDADKDFEQDQLLRLTRPKETKVQ